MKKLEQLLEKLNNIEATSEKMVELATRIETQISK